MENVGNFTYQLTKKFFYKYPLSLTYDICSFRESKTSTAVTVALCNSHIALLFAAY